MSFDRNLEELNALIDKREGLLAKRLAMDPSDKRDRLVRKMQNRLTRNYEQRDELTGQPQPFDEFNIRLECEERGNRKFGMIYVDIFDSPLDDTFTGGDPIIMRSSFADGKGMDDNGRTWSSRATTRTSAFANGDYWNGDNEQTLAGGSTSLAYTLENFDDGTVTLYKDPGEGSWAERKENMTPFYSQNFYELC